MSVSRPCAVCGEFFDAQRPNAKFCGATCRQRSKRLGRPGAAAPAGDVAESVGAGLLAPVAAAGDRLATLRALRDVLARQIDASSDPFGLPALATRLQSVLEQIAAIAPPEVTGSVLDELAKRRSASGAPGAKVGAQRR